MAISLMPVHVGVGTKKEIGQKMENGVGEQAKGEQVTCSPYIDCLQLVLIGQGVTCNHAYDSLITIFNL